MSQKKARIDLELGQEKKQSPKVRRIVLVGSEDHRPVVAITLVTKPTVSVDWRSL
jgi:hypothetical protein